MTRDKVVLAYSGGLDTSVAIRWLQDRGMDVVTLTIDVGQPGDLDGIREKARRLGAKTHVVDARREFAEQFVLPGLQANAMYEGQYPLSTALARPPIGKHLLAAAPDEAAHATIHFDGGKPTALQGRSLEFVDLIASLNELAGRHGVGRIDHVESRVVGIKSREVYECPAATVLVKAHQALEALVLPRDLLEFQRSVAARYATLVYDGLWFTPLREALDAFVASTQERVTGDVSVKLFKGAATVVGRASPYSLYDHALATYSQGDRFRQSMAEGFIYVWGLPARTWAAAGEKAPTAPKLLKAAKRAK